LNFSVLGRNADIMTHATFCDNRFRGFEVLIPQFCHSRPYNSVSTTVLHCNKREVHYNDRRRTHNLNINLRYRRGTARRAMLGEILSTAAPLYENTFERLAVANDLENDKVIGVVSIRMTTYHFLLMICSNNDSYLTPFPRYYHIYSV